MSVKTVEKCIVMLYIISLASVFTILLGGSTTVLTTIGIIASTIALVLFAWLLLIVIIKGE